jgi:hypothetical protein
LLLLAAVVACGSPALTPGGAQRAPGTADAADVEEVALEISALM